MLHASFMTGNIMKSELLDSAVRFKRMSKGSPVANGTTTAEDEESMVRQATLAAAFHDHISCAKPPADFCKIREEGRDERAALPCETDHIYANSSDAKTATKDQEAQQLKEMLLLQLELIQHQQEQLLKKDRQLQVANQEKEALKTRLERMERRLALMKHRQEERSDDESAQETNQSSLSGSNLSRSNSSSSTSGTTNRAEKCLSPFLSSGLKRGETRESRQQRAAVRSIKRRYASQSRTAAKRHFASLSKERSSSSSCQPKEKSSRSRSSSRESSNASVQNRRTSSTSWTPRRSKGSSSPRGKDAALRKQPENILRTDKLYYTPVGDSWKSLESSCKEIVIEVPSWRYHPVTSCYQLEGTENIDDEVFAKRHFKLEVDERRRKRWDIQRIREQRQNEKLRKGRRGDKDREEDGRRWNGDIRSFYPDPKGVHFVEIANTVPVVAFGTPLPKFQPCEFSLPWFDIAAREKREAQQQKPGKQRSYSGTRRGT